MSTPTVVAGPTRTSVSTLAPVPTLPPDPVQGAKNATGGGYHSDGRILVIVLQ